MDEANLIAAVRDDPGSLDDLFAFLVDSEDQVLALIAWLRSQPAPPPTPPAGGSIEAGLVLYWVHHPPAVVQAWLDAHLPILWPILLAMFPPTQISEADYAYLWTTVDTVGAVWEDGTLFGTGTYEQLDTGWLWPAVNYLVNLLDPSDIHPLVIPAGGAPALDAASADGPILAIVGDWGTGFFTEDDVECPAQRIAGELAGLGYDYLVHLGDVYYAGTDLRPPPGEEQDNFVAVWPEARPSRSLILNSNHEMYGGAQGLYDVALTAPAFQGQASSSIWARTAGPWLVLGLDSARYADAQNGDQMYMVGAIGSSIDTDQIAWLTQFRGHEGPILVVTHHNPCDVVTGVTNVLFEQVQEALGATPDLWYWGHVHNGIVYDQLLDDGAAVPTRGRCCGHGSIPFGDAWGLDGNANVAYYAHTKDPAYPADNPRVLNGYATVQLHPDGTCTEAFYEIGRGMVWPPSTTG